MFGPFSNLQYRPCPECGASVAAVNVETHECDRERWLDHQMLLLRDEVEGLHGEVESYLGSPKGRFELWYAELERRRRV